MRLALTFVPYIPQKKNAEWENSNITKSTREESLDESDAMRAITNIKRPSFERMPGNKDDKTFDQIRIRLGIVGKDTMPNRNDKLRRDQRTLARIALAKIRDTKSFQRYGIPVNFLRLDHMTITCQDELELATDLACNAVDFKSMRRQDRLRVCEQAAIISEFIDSTDETRFTLYDMVEGILDDPGSFRLEAFPSHETWYEAILDKAIAQHDKYEKYEK